MEQPTAVIVEDELLFAQALTAFLEDLGYQVLATADGEEGTVQVVCERRPDVMLMDLKLLDGNGVGAAIMIRANFKVPIIFCTSYAANGAIQLAVQSLGNAALIGKPFDEAELAALSANAVKKQLRDRMLHDSRRS